MGIGNNGAGEHLNTVRDSVDLDLESVVSDISRRLRASPADRPMLEKHKRKEREARLAELARPRKPKTEADLQAREREREERERVDAALSGSLGLGT